MPARGCHPPAQEPGVSLADVGAAGAERPCRKPRARFLIHRHISTWNLEGRGEEEEKSMPRCQRLRACRTEGLIPPAAGLQHVCPHVSPPGLCLSQPEETKAHVTCRELGNLGRFESIPKAEFQALCCIPGRRVRPCEECSSETCRDLNFSSKVSMQNKQWQQPVSLCSSVELAAPGAGSLREVLEMGT